MERNSKTDLLLALPGVAAITVGAIYALGALAIYRQIDAAGINAVEMMPLVPLNQILGRGIGAITSDIEKALPIGLISVCLPLAVDQIPAQGLDEDRWSAINKVLTGVAAFTLAAAIAMSQPAIAVAGILGGLVGVPLVLSVRRMQGSRGLHDSRHLALTMLMFALTALLVTSTALSFLKPAPLPSITLVRSKGRPVHGALITKSGGSWYIGHRNGSVEAIATATVKRSLITHQYPDRERSLLDLVLNRPATNMFRP